ncbi:DUF3365 domain-containing protein [Thioalkalicoccus limnaeus]|uniref:DUF3365 domain-containing protein n=1 Tax=Thioalkalicoccus limnaeus TaxID=120681 RepID=A0ABV4BAT0_9GAMM
MNNSHLFTILATLVPLAPFAGSVYAEVEDPRVTEAKAIVQEFGTALMGELTTALQTEGPIAAIEICRHRAPAIAEELSERTGWEVGRTSLKTRNLATNTPDAWETHVLEQFDARRAAGEDIQPMAHAAVIADEDGERFRFMKAIPTVDLCLTCHGQTLAPEIAAAIDAAYPGDQARGYETGMVRGAFSLSKSLSGE